MAESSPNHAHKPALPSLDAVASAPGMQVVSDPRERPLVQLYGRWNLRALEPQIDALSTQLARHRTAGWDLSRVITLDQAGALILWRAWGHRLAEPLVLRPEHQALFTHLQPPQLYPGRRSRPSGSFVLHLGAACLSLLEHVRGFIALLGHVSLDLLRLLRHRERVPWKEISANLYRTGAQALGITALVGFLVGVVLSYLSAQQLRAFGADVYIVNLLGVAIVRELGPVLAAILIAGRSGSAITAQLGVMRVTEELDALEVMGISHTLRLVLPRVIALAIAMPLLILWTNTIALIGGMVSAQLQLGIDYRYFISSLPAAVPLSNLWLGLGKGMVFGIFIALVACHFGLRIKPNTESLGQGTTSSVVTAITLVILLDAVFAILFRNIGSFLR